MKKITKIEEDVTEIFYPSISDVMQDIKKLKDDGSQLYRATYRRETCSSNLYRFHYFDTYEEAEAALIGGKWETGIAQLNDAFTLENKNFEDRKRQKMFYDVVGYQASVPRYLQGLPTNMVNSRPIPKQEKVFTIVKHIGYLANVTTAEIIDNSAKALAILNQLEKRGIRCNLDVYSPVIDLYGYGKGVIRIRLKNANERLTIGKLAFPLANPDMLRRFIFGLRKMNAQSGAWEIFEKDYGAGRTIEDVAENKRYLDAVGIKNCIFLNNHIESPETELRRNGLIK